MNLSASTLPSPKSLKPSYTTHHHHHITNNQPLHTPTNTPKFKFRQWVTVNLQTQSPEPHNPPEKETGVIVIGAGLAGLSAATHLASKNIPFKLLEASDAVGGRVRTDTLDGFLLDRGFQIFITAYPEARALLDYQSLNLQKFYPGALVYFNGEFHRVSDPFRHFLDGLMSLTNPIGTFFDKILVGLVRIKAASTPDDQILISDEVSISAKLGEIGLSDLIVDRFFRPFFGGIFFDTDLETSSRLFDFILKCLALGDNTLPGNGIAAIPEQLAGKLPLGSLHLNSKVVSIDLSDGSPMVRLEDGSVVGSELGVIVSVEEPEAVKLLGADLENSNKKPVRSTICLYFSADVAPIKEPILILNGSGKGIVNNMFFATNVAPSYGPVGKVLVSVSLIGKYEGVSDDDLRDRATEELSGWFGDSVVKTWKHLRTYRIGFAQPNQSPPTDLRKNPAIGTGVYVCGDYRDSATFDGALVSGRRAVEALLKDMALSRV